MQRAKWLDLNHTFIKLAKKFKEKRVVVAVSGGLDSVVLLDLLMKAQFKKLAVAHVHHGGRFRFRSQAARFMQKNCQERGLEFFLLGPAAKSLSSEAAMREFRYHQLEELRQQLGFDLIALAHHQDDVFETRLLNLIRGTAGAGLISLKEVSHFKWRPLLQVPKKRLQMYARQTQLQWVEDPSNQSVRYFRNWIRYRWLRDLERKRAGALSSFARSLQNLAEAESIKKPVSSKKKGPIKLLDYLALSPAEQRKELVGAVRACGLKEFSLGQIKEIQKRLDKNQKQHTFQVGCMLWEVNAGLIQTSFIPQHKV